MDADQSSTSANSGGDRKMVYCCSRMHSSDGATNREVVLIVPAKFAVAGSLVPRGAKA